MIEVSMLFMVSSKDHTLVYTNEVTQGRPLDCSRLGLTMLKEPSCDKRTGAVSHVILALPPELLGEEEARD